MPKDILINSLFEAYGKLLTTKQYEITEMYYSCDLSLGEIAEIKGVSRQSISDTLNTVRAELGRYESSLGLCRIKDELKKLCETVDSNTARRLTEIIE